MGEGTNPSHFKEEGAERPVEQVSWDDCQEFLGRINKGLDGLVLSLPSEVQWEYACRAGTTTARYLEEIAEIAWYDKNSGDGTRPVRQKLPNGWGLYDLLGNVWEWCEDPWRKRGETGPAESADASDSRVVRGGSWFYDPRFIRAAYRGRVVPSNRDYDLGFRCAEFRSGA